MFQWVYGSDQKLYNKISVESRFPGSLRVIHVSPLHRNKL